MRAIFSFTKCLFCGLFGTAVILSSCDSEYDLSKDISSELNLGGSLGLPLGETDTLKLSRVIELDDVITINDDGAYEIVKSGTLTVNVPEVEKIIVDGMSARPVIEDVFDNVPGSDQPSDFSFTNPLKYFSSIDTEEHVPVNAKKITDMYFEPFNAELSIEFSFNDPTTLSKLENLRLHNFTINFPKFIVFGEGIEGMNYATNIMTINRDIPENGLLKIEIPIVDIAEIPDVDQTTHTIKFTREIEFKGDLSADVKNATRQEMSSMIVTTEFNIPDFEIDRIRGVLAPDIEIDAENIELDNIPDVLTNENTSINVNTVATTMQIENPTGIPYYVDLLFTAFDKNDNKINSEVTARIHIPQAIDFEVSKISKYYITNNSNLKAPEGYELVVIPELNQLIRQIPNYVHLTPTITIDESKEHFSQLGVAYSTSADYDIEMPFDFGENSKIEYTDSFDGIQDDLADIVDKITEMEVYADVTNTIPLNLTLNAVPYDYAGNDMSDRVEITKDLLIEPGNDNTPVQSKEILLKERVKGALKDLDRVEVIINGDTRTANTILKPSQYVIIKMKAKLPQGIAIDLDE